MRIRAVGIVFGLSVSARRPHRPSAGQHAGDAACSVAGVQAKAPAGTTITGGRGRRRGTAAAPLPRGRPRRGAGQRGELQARPAQAWNGKYYFVGVGGLGGTIGKLNAGLTRGYASASTDTGHVERSDLGREPRQGDRLRPSRDARHGRCRQGADDGVLRQAAGARLLQRLLERRPAGDDGSAALSRRTSTASSPAIPPPARRCRSAARSCSSTCC